MTALRILLGLLLFCSASWAQVRPLTTRYERTNGRETATYAEIIQFYQALDRQFAQAKLQAVGPTDAGQPLHVLLLDADRQFGPTDRKVTVLVNNGIHPGEPDGIDASMLWVRDLLRSGRLPRQVRLAIVPVYNIGGCLNRGTSRANQNGPAAYGFRGNTRNYDLNRDFAKADTEDARSWQRLFQQLKPHVLIDNHTSNGADYQHVLTYFATQKDKLHPYVAQYMAGRFQPELDRALTERGFAPIPYVNNFTDTPESGIAGFNDSPRYSSGYAALFNCMGFVVETHMLKDYASRVRGTYAFMDEALRLIARDAAQLVANKRRADEAVRRQGVYALSYRLDRSRADSVLFRGYAARYKPSEVTGRPRLYYDRTAPFTKPIPYWNTFVPNVVVKKPRYYVVPQGWSNVVAHLKRNGVRLQALRRDTLMDVVAYAVLRSQTPNRAYEGHYLRVGVQVRPQRQRVALQKGDWLVPTDQPANRYVVAMLEPQGVDSFFAWNVFDSVLGQKEYFSDYVFEDTAAELLRRDSTLRRRFDARRAADTAFANSARAQLNYIYRNSPYYEKTFSRYPIFRVE